MKYCQRIIILTFALFSIGLASCRQEKVIFYPDKLAPDHQFKFDGKFREMFFQVDKKTKLNGLLFYADSSRGLVFYLHGNGGCIDSWGKIAGIYTACQYDFFIPDYRGYGKSEGKIRSEKQFYNDLQIIYDSLKKLYDETKIVLIGYSIGTGPAAKLAADNHPGLLILKAPYYNLPDLAHQFIKIIPSCFIRYKFSTNEFIPKVKCPVTIFHGDKDEVIYTGSSYKLEKLFKKGDTLIILPGQKHNGMNGNEQYLSNLKKLLNNKW